MRLGYMAQDAPHLQYPANKCCKHMSVPTAGGMTRLKRVARFLRGQPRCVQKFTLQYADNDVLDVYCDSDWAADLLDRKSVSSVFIFRGKHLVKSLVSSQGVIALSSGEAEFQAGVKAVSVSLGTCSLSLDLGVMLRPRLHIDSSAAIGIFKRQGIGRIRHLHTPLLWVQQKRANKEIEVSKTPGRENPADLGTKELSRPDMDKHLKRCYFVFLAGRHPKALSAQFAPAVTADPYDGGE